MDSPDGAFINGYGITQTNMKLARICFVGSDMRSFHPLPLLIIYKML